MHNDEREVDRLKRQDEQTMQRQAGRFYDGRPATSVRAPAASAGQVVGGPPELQDRLEKLCARLWTIRGAVEAVADRIDGPRPENTAATDASIPISLSAWVEAAHQATSAIEDQLQRLEGRV